MSHKTAKFGTWIDLVLADLNVSLDFGFTRFICMLNVIIPYAVVSRVHLGGLQEEEGFSLRFSLN